MPAKGQLHRGPSFPLAQLLQTVRAASRRLCTYLPSAQSEAGSLRGQGQSPPPERSWRRNNLLEFKACWWMRLLCDPWPPGLRVHLMSPPGSCSDPRLRISPIPGCHRRPDCLTCWYSSSDSRTLGFSPCPSLLLYPSPRNCIATICLSTPPEPCPGNRYPTFPHTQSPSIWLTPAPRGRRSLRSTACQPGPLPPMPDSESQVSPTLSPPLLSAPHPHGQTRLRLGHS